ncbi:MAG: TlpA disulfide reductase family protein [Gelidibacter sp.]
MKHLLFITLLMAMVACKKEEAPKDYAVLHGKITNPIDTLDLRLYDAKNNKTIMVDVDADGNFRDTLKLDSPATFTAVYNNAFSLHLKNDMDVKVEFDNDNLSKTIKFSGKGEAENNFLKFKNKETNDLYGEDYKDYFSLDQKAFDDKTKAYIGKINKELESKQQQLDSAFMSGQKEALKVFEEQNFAQYQEQQKINKLLAKGNPSPEFNNYVNYAGGTSSLKDYRGSYVYIDVWATWCGPCKYEIPFLEKVEKEYHDKNIKFVSVSIDAVKDEQKWRDMIKAKNMGGIQLLADKDYESQFISDYFIYGIPRFILLDPQGNIVTYDAPRPSEEKLKTLFNSLDI